MLSQLHDPSFPVSKMNSSMTWMKEWLQAMCDAWTMNRSARFRLMSQSNSTIIVLCMPFSNPKFAQAIECTVHHLNEWEFPHGICCCFVHFTSMKLQGLDFVAKHWNTHIDNDWQSPMMLGRLSGHSSTQTAKHGYYQNTVVNAMSIVTAEAAVTD